MTAVLSDREQSIHLLSSGLSFSEPTLLQQYPFSLSTISSLFIVWTLQTSSSPYSVLICFIHKATLLTPLVELTALL